MARCADRFWSGEARAIKKELPTVPVLLFTLYNSSELERESKQAGADAVLAWNPEASGHRNPNRR